MSNVSKERKNNVISFIISQKGKEVLLWNGYRHNLNVTNKDGTTRWRCPRRECNASVKLDGERNKVMDHSKHSCMRSEAQNEIDILVDKCKRDVCTSGSSVQQIFESNFEHLDPLSETVEKMPLFISKKDTLYRARRKHLNVKYTETRNLCDVQIPEIIAENFLVANNGSEDKILIFSTKLTRNTLKHISNKSPKFYGDGTFKRTPVPFYQLFTLHIDLNTGDDGTSLRVLPVIYALLPNKTQETYVRLFQLIKDEFDLEINHYMCDFEIAQINGMKTVFPDCKVTGCYYHYSKAVWKKARKIKLTETYEGCHITRLVASLPLLPPEHIEDGWFDIKQECNSSDEETDFIEYFESQWVKLLPQIVSCAGEKQRTNNSIEGWHRRINARISTKPTLILFFTKLKKEALWQHFKIRQILFEIKRDQKDIKFDKIYRNELMSLNEGKISVLAFLKKICQCKRLLGWSK